MKLSVAIVNYNAGYRLRQCIESIARHAPSVPYEVLVVDNDSKDGSADFLASWPDPRVRLVRNAHNLGFTGGYNQAFGLTTGEYFLFFNADQMATPGFFDTLVRHMDEDPSLGGATGHSTSPRGDFEKYLNRFPRPYDLYLTNFVPREKAERNAGYRRYHMLGEDFSGPVEVPQPAGGCLLVRRALFPDGLMSPEFGIFFSDVEVARRIHAQGKRIVVYPDAPFVHDHNWTKKPTTPASLLVSLDYYVGCARYFRKYDGLGAYLQVKLLFGARLLGRLLLVELPDALRGRETWEVWRTRAKVLWAFLRDRNLLLERELRRAASARDAPTGSTRS